MRVHNFYFYHNNKIHSSHLILHRQFINDFLFFKFIFNRWQTFLNVLWKDVLMKKCTCARTNLAVGYSVEAMVNSIRKCSNINSTFCLISKNSKGKLKTAWIMKNSKVFCLCSKRTAKICGPFWQRLLKDNIKNILKKWQRWMAFFQRVILFRKGLNCWTFPLTITSK